MIPRYTFRRLIEPKGHQLWTIQRNTLSQGYQVHLRGYKPLISSKRHSVVFRALQCTYLLVFVVSWPTYVVNCSDYNTCIQLILFELS